MPVYNFISVKLVLYIYFQGNNLDLARWELLVCRFSWILAASFLYYMYGGFLTAGLITTSFKWQPDTWEELLDSDYTVGTFYKSSYSIFYELTSSSILNRFPVS